MQLPFKYIVLCIIKMLNDRDMPLIINKSNLLIFCGEFVKKAYFTIDEKSEIKENFDFQFELDDLLDNYFEYFENNDSEIIFDNDYIAELEELISKEMIEYELGMIQEVDYAIEYNTNLLEIIGVKIKKDLYNYLLSMYKKIEDSYMELCDYDNYIGLSEIDTKELIDDIKKTNFRRMIMTFNTKNLLSDVEFMDLLHYSCNFCDDNDDCDDVELLLEDEEFDQYNIMYDVFNRSIFTVNDLHMASLRDKLYTYNIDNKNIRYSKMKFYLTFLNLLEEEIKKSNELISIELVTIKYRLMYALDIAFDTITLINRDILRDADAKENYTFIENEIYYFINELLMYEDSMYKNEECNADNIMVYIDNIVKKLLIETYYKLTKDNKVISTIKENKLYGVNTISSAFLKAIAEKPKTKIKDK